MNEINETNINVKNNILQGSQKVHPSITNFIKKQPFMQTLLMQILHQFISSTMLRRWSPIRLFSLSFQHFGKLNFPYYKAWNYFALQQAALISFP